MATDAPKRPYLLSNRVYDILKILALIVFPAIATLYFTLANIWGWGSAEQVVGSIAAFDVFLGAIIKIGDATYNASEARFDGAMVVEHDPAGAKTISLNLKDHPETLLDKQEVTFKVQPISAKGVRS